MTSRVAGMLLVPNISFTILGGVQLLEIFNCSSYRFVGSDTNVLTVNIEH